MHRQHEKIEQNSYLLLSVCCSDFSTNFPLYSGCMAPGPPPPAGAGAGPPDCFYPAAAAAAVYREVQSKHTEIELYLKCLTFQLKYVKWVYKE